MILEKENVCFFQSRQIYRKGSEGFEQRERKTQTNPYLKVVLVDFQVQIPVLLEMLD